MRMGTATLIACVAVAGCGGNTLSSPSAQPGVAVPPAPSTIDPVSVGPSAPQIFVGAGDIATCDGNAEATARLLDGIGGTIFTLGDNAYFHGSTSEYRQCYDPTWGRHRHRTRS